MWRGGAAKSAGNASPDGWTVVPARKCKIPVQGKIIHGEKNGLPVDGKNTKPIIETSGEKRVVISGRIVQEKNLVKEGEWGAQIEGTRVQKEEN